MLSLHSVVCNVGGPCGPTAGIFQVRFPLGEGTQNDNAVVNCKCWDWGLGVHWLQWGASVLPPVGDLSHGDFQGRKKTESEWRLQDWGGFEGLLASSLINSKPQAFRPSLWVTCVPPAGGTFPRPWLWQHPGSALSHFRWQQGGMILLTRR